MDKSEDIKELATAMVAAQGEITGAAKDATNPHFRTRYADLSSVMEACKGALNRHGIAVLQSPAPSEQGTLAIDTVLMHSSGQWCSGRTVIPLQKVDPQGYGSAMTYARRYSLAAMVGVCPEDDDAEGSMERGQQRRPSSRAIPPSGSRHIQPGEPNDAEKFDIRLMEVAEANGFDIHGLQRIEAKVCSKKQVARVADLSAGDREALIRAIADGKFDKLKGAVAA